MQPASVVLDTFPELLGRLPPGLDLDALAVATKAIERPRKVCDGTTLFRLAMAYGPGGMSLNQVAAWAAMGGLARLSDPAVKYRLDKADGFLRAVMDALLAARTQGAALRWPGRVLRVSDSTSISQRASLGTDWRVHAVLDLGTGGFSHLELTDNTGAEFLARGTPLPGEVRIADRNYAGAQALHALQHSAERVDFIVRARWNSFALCRPNGTAFDLISHLQALGASAPGADTPGADTPCADTPGALAPGTLHEVAVQARVSRHAHLPLRLIIQRRPEGEVENTRHHLRRQASRKQKALDPRTEVAAGFLVLATSLPASTCPTHEVLAAYALRWQVELAFKRLKSLLHIDQLPTRTPAASRSWLYAHLILALLCDNMTRDVLALSPSGTHRHRANPVAVAHPQARRFPAAHGRARNHPPGPLARPEP